VTRQKRKSKRGNKKNVNSPPASKAAKTKITRRDFFEKIGYRALGAAVVGGGSWFFVEEVRATMRETDLSLIGNGVPAIVQIHDPQCPLCVTLQRESRDALCEIDGSQLQFFVANIRTSKGRQFAATHDVGHVTLLLFDGRGRRRAVLVGPNNSEDLAGIFQRHLAKYGKS
jgi:hypothetical protein